MPNRQDPVPTAESATGKIGYGTLLQPYLKSIQIFKCPSDSHDVANSYMINNYVGESYEPRAMAAVESPSLVMLLMDGYGGGQGGDFSPSSGPTKGFGLNQDYTVWNSSYRVASKDAQMPRHLGTSNILYFDGHVKSTKPLENDNSLTARRAVLEAALPYQIAVNPNKTGCCGMPDGWD